MYRIIIKCEYCSKLFKKYICHIKRVKHTFCSKKCKALWQKSNLLGNKNPFFNKKHSIKTKEKLSNINKGRKSWNKNMEAHHIYPFSLILQNFLKEYSQFSPIDDKETLLRLAITYKPFWNIDNGKTLCKDCHYKLKKETFNKIAVTFKQTE